MDIVETKKKIEELKSQTTKDPDYFKIHMFIRYYYGRANRCENDSSHIGRHYDWANVTGVYSKDIKNFKQLCKQCHRKIDFTDNFREVKKLQGLLQNQIMPQKGRSVVRYSQNGEVTTFKTISEAARASGIVKGGIHNCLRGDAKTAGGYQWKYKELTS